VLVVDPHRRQLDPQVGSAGAAAARWKPRVPRPPRRAALRRTSRALEPSPCSASRAPSSRPRVRGVRSAQWRLKSRSERAQCGGLRTCWECSHRCRRAEKGAGQGYCPSATRRWPRARRGARRGRRGTPRSCVWRSACPRASAAGRIHVLAVALDPEADVRAGREPGLAHVADHLLLLDPVAHAHAVGIAREVRVRGDVAVVVADLDEVAVAARPAALDHHAVGDRQTGVPIGAA
jgi:hypothetical protein